MDRWHGLWRRDKKIARLTSNPSALLVPGTRTFGSLRHPAGAPNRKPHAQDYDGNHIRLP
jgi:hypothetical protein